MPRIININVINEEEIIKEMRNGKIFIYPTDTIYGLGCNALDSYAVRKIRDIKKRSLKPFSVIAPNKEWIFKNFKVLKKEHVNKLPGPFTFILERKTSNSVAREVALRSNSVGVRIPNCKFTEIVRRAKIPFVTTSVNISGKKYATSIKDIEREIFDRVDIIIENGVLNRRPSILLDYRESIPKIVKR